MKEAPKEKNLKEFFIEIHSEEVPPRVQSFISQRLNELFCEAFLKEKIIFKQKNIKNFYCDTKIFFAIDHLAQYQISPATQKRGPKVGADEKQISGFLNRFPDYKKEDLIKDNGYYCLKLKKQNIATSKILENIIPKILEKISHSLEKSMKWFENQNVLWIRPIRNLMAVFDGKLLEVKFINLTANNNLIFENRGKKIVKIDSITKYLTSLKENFIIIDQQQRKEIIDKAIKQKLKNLNYVLMGENQNLIDEIIGISNYPLVLEGEISKKFLHLPAEILQLTMKNNQKFICLQDENGNMAHKFIFIANKTSNKFNESRVITENNKILEARLSDAQFFIEEDLKIPLESRFLELENIVFHAKLGSMAEKTRRIEILNKFISLWVPHSDISLIHNMSLLVKADLASKAVAEFTELQGIMGAYYAKEENYDEKISLAIKEHYLPAGPNSPIPQTPLGCLISICDKLDNICGLFLANQKPTSSKDPFATRRATLGIIRIISENQIRFLLKLAIDKSLKSFSGSIIKKLYPDKSKRQISELFINLNAEIIEFFLERIRFFLKGDNIDARVINKVFDSAARDNKNYNISEIISKIHFMNNFINNQDNQDFLQINKRIFNLLQSCDDNYIRKKPKKRYIKNNSELALFLAIKDIKVKSKKPMVGKNYQEYFNIITEITNVTKVFIDENKIDDENINIKNNRFAMLNDIKDLANRFFDFRDL